MASKESNIIVADLNVTERIDAVLTRDTPSSLVLSGAHPADYWRETYCAE